MAYRSCDFKEALTWYNYSLSLFPAPTSTDKNLGKLQACGRGERGGEGQGGGGREGGREERVWDVGIFVHLLLCRGIDVPASCLWASLRRLASHDSHVTIM